MSHRNRDDFIRQLWMADFEFKEDLPNAQVFERASDGARVLVPKRDSIGSEWATARLRNGAEASHAHTSPCCKAESVFRAAVNGKAFLRCTACTRTWSKPAAQHPALRIVD